MPTPPDLLVDFGSSQVIAVITRDDGSTEPLLVDGASQLPVPLPGETATPR